MSVPKPLRSESSADFIEIARRLEIRTLYFCKNNIPKRYTFLIAEHIASLADEVHSEVVKGNQIYLSNPTDREERKKHFQRALSALAALTAKIEIAEEMLHPPNNTIAELGELCLKEKKSIKSIIASDAKRIR